MRHSEHEPVQQVVVVLGGTSGVGLATARRMSAAGQRVIISGRDHVKLDTALASIGGDCSGEAFDATQRPALDRFFAATGAIDHLVLAFSGGEGAGLFRELDLAALRRGFDAKFWPQAEAAQASLAALRSGGSITFLTSISARTANPGTAGLGAINGALEAMIGALARELAPTRVNAVAPGVVDTPWWDRMPADAKRRVFEEQARILPVGRVGQPDEIAHAVQFLIENGFMTGSIIECDGGLRLL
jgi:NAD(P)-dependent dehydrogenase (short-subunit alcohol dehydrogenase family)